MSRRPKRSTSERIVRALVSLAFTFYGGWMFMLAVGVVHHEWIHTCPTLGYWWSLLLAALVRAALYNFDLDDEGGVR